jgi:ABC-2 type transport system permease protein
MSMYKLWATIKKDGRILIRDKIGLTLMFVMPIMLAIVIAMVQNSTYELVNNKKIPLLIINRDTGDAGRVLESSLEKGGMFIIKKLPQNASDSMLKTRMQNKEALLGLIIPEKYSSDVAQKAEEIASQALQTISVDTTASHPAEKYMPTAVALFYHPVLQNSFRQAVGAALSSTLQIVQSKFVVRQMYSGINQSAIIPDTLEQEILSNQTPINQFPVSKSSSTIVPNATQHNIPAWTIFAMFFIVISMGSSIVREKNSGSFLRLKTLPTSLSVSIFSKQITYIFITVLQAIVIFAMGKWLFPKLGMPALNFPDDKWGLLLITFISGWCAASFALCVGIFAKTQEQSNGIGAISIVLFAAIGGLLVPAFAMPDSFQNIMKISPLHWCLEAFYGLFLEGGKLKDIIHNLIPILVIIAVLQLAAWIGMKRLRLI